MLLHRYLQNSIRLLSIQVLSFQLK